MFAGLRVTAVATMLAATSITAASQPQSTGVRQVTATAQTIIEVQTRLRFATDIILPEGETIVKVNCGDKDFWVVDADENEAHVKPAKEGATSNLDLKTTSGTTYSFLLREKAGAGLPDLKVFVNADSNTENRGKPKYYTAEQFEHLQGQLADARSALDTAQRRATEAIASYRQEYPTRLQFVYGTFKYEKPFAVRSIWHDGQATYIKTDAQELPAVYEIKDGNAALVNFQVQGGNTYVVPKVLDRGYLALGKARLSFAQQTR
jgi:type IV secretory pathway VirB9-like protein